MSSHAGRHNGTMAAAASSAVGSVRGSSSDKSATIRFSWTPPITAFVAVTARANAGAPGVDGMTFGQIEAADIDAWLASLREDLVSKSYQPDPVRRVMIPKPGGGERPLGIPTIRDRVVQAAAKIVLEPIFEADFEDGAYGYRPRRSAIDAVKETHRLLCRGYTRAIPTSSMPTCRSISTRSRTRTSSDRWPAVSSTGMCCG